LAGAFFLKQKSKSRYSAISILELGRNFADVMLLPRHFVKSVLSEHRNLSTGVAAAQFCGSQAEMIYC
jgi:hypothetical protein